MADATRPWWHWVLTNQRAHGQRGGDSACLMHSLSPMAQRQSKAINNGAQLHTPGSGMIVRRC